jgi:glycerol-3-phosphate acyltransferase PlsY
VATAGGVLLGIDPLLGLVTLGIWLAVAFTLRYSSLAALIAAAAAPLVALLSWGGGTRSLVVGIIAIALIVKHWSNLQRLMAGTEPKIGAKKKA